MRFMVFRIISLRVECEDLQSPPFQSRFFADDFRQRNPGQDLNIRQSMGRNWSMTRTRLHGATDADLQRCGMRQLMPFRAAEAQAGMEASVMCSTASPNVSQTLRHVLSVLSARVVEKHGTNRIESSCPPWRRYLKIDGIGLQRPGHDTVGTYHGRIKRA